MNFNHRPLVTNYFHFSAFMNVRTNFKQSRRSIWQKKRKKNTWRREVNTPTQKLYHSSKYTIHWGFSYGSEALKLITFTPLPQKTKQKNFTHIHTHAHTHTCTHAHTHTKKESEREKERDQRFRVMRPGIISRQLPTWCRSLHRKWAGVEITPGSHSI